MKCHVNVVDLSKGHTDLTDILQRIEYKVFSHLALS